MTEARDRGTLDRRDFLRLSLLTPATLLVTSGCQNLAIQSRLAQFGRVNDWVGEKLVTPSRRAPVYPESARTISFPAYHRSRAMPVLEHPAEWRLQVDGLARTPLQLSQEMLHTLPQVTYTVKHHCVEGWTAIATWGGVPFTSVMDLAGVHPAARFVRFESFDSGYSTGWDMATAAHPQSILALRFNGSPLAPDHGAPLRLYSPLKLGYKNIKYLTRVTFTDTRPGGYWEDRGYPWHGGL